MVRKQEDKKMSADFTDEQMRQLAKMSSVDEVDAALGNKESLKNEFQSAKEVERLTAMVEEQQTLLHAMWLMLQADTPDDYVIATNETRTVREFADTAFKHVGIDLKWEGEGVDEKGIDVKTGKVLVSVNPEFFRPAEVELLLGDPAKAEKKLGWRREIDFSSLVKRMVENDLKIVKEENGL